MKLLFSLLALSLAPALAQAGEVICTGEEQEVTISWQDFDTHVAFKDANGKEQVFKNCSIDKEGKTMAIDCVRRKSSGANFTAQLKGGVIHKTTFSYELDGKKYPGLNLSDLDSSYFQLTCKQE